MSQLKINEPYTISNLFSTEEIRQINEILNSFIDSNEGYEDYNLGRIVVGVFQIPADIRDRLTKLANEFTGLTLNPGATASIVTYSNKYGAPHLPPHFDRDHNEVVIDYQLDSNTRWPLGVDLVAHDLEDNSAVIFNPNTNVHWRPHKTFKDGEYVTMIFFRFTREVPVDYSHLPQNENDPVFKEVREYRDSFSLD